MVVWICACPMRCCSAGKEMPARTISAPKVWRKRWALACGIWLRGDDDEIENEVRRGSWPAHAGGLSSRRTRRTSWWGAFPAADIFRGPRSTLAAAAKRVSCFLCRAPAFAPRPVGDPGAEEPALRRNADRRATSGPPGRDRERCESCARTWRLDLARAAQPRAGVAVSGGPVPPRGVADHNRAGTVGVGALEMRLAGRNVAAIVETI